MSSDVARLALNPQDVSVLRSFAVPQSIGQSTALSNPSAQQAAVERVQLYLYVTRYDTRVLDELGSLGVQVQRVSQDRVLLQVSLDPTRLNDLAQLPYVRSITTPDYGAVNAGSRHTEGDALLDFSALREAVGVDGTGITIGVITDGIAGIEAAIASGNLPPTRVLRQDGKLIGASGGVMAQSFRADGNLEAGIETGISAEGTAMLEVIHDIAPGAQLRFVNFSTSLEFMDAVDFLAGLCDVIVDDIAFFGHPYDQSSVMSRNTAAALNNPQNRLRAYFTAVGNNAVRHYRGGYDDSGIDGLRFTNEPGRLHLFGPTSDTTDVMGFGSYIANPIFLKSGSSVSVILNWNDYGDTDTDYDMYLFRNTTGALVTASKGDNIGLRLPVEGFNYTNTGPDGFFDIVIQNYDNASRPRTFDLFVVGGDPLPGSDIYINFNTPSGSVPANSDAGGGVISVGAVDASDPGLDRIQPYSGRGPLNNGAIKPDVVAVDGVSISGAGGFGRGGSRGPIFIGTSATSPHLGAVAALLLELQPGLRAGEPGDNPSADRSALRSAILAGAVDLGSPGPDNTFGHGRINGLAAAIGWQTSNSRVLTIDSSGQLSALSQGKAALTARVGGFQTTLNVNVVGSINLQGGADMDDDARPDGSFFSDKPGYNIAFVTVNSPVLNTSAAADSIDSLVSFHTSALQRGALRPINALETGPNTGLFEARAAIFADADFRALSLAAGSSANDADNDGVVQVSELNRAGQLGEALNTRVQDAALSLGLAPSSPASSLLAVALPAADGETLTSSYDDGGVIVSASAQIDLQPPVIEILSPSLGSYSNSLAQTLRVRITDQPSRGGRASGIAPSDVASIVVDAANGPNLGPILAPAQIAPNSYEVSRHLIFSPGDEGAIQWWAPIKDRVGNAPEFIDHRTPSQRVRDLPNQAVPAAGNPSDPTSPPGNPARFILDTAAPVLSRFVSPIVTGGSIDRRLAVSSLIGIHLGPDSPATLASPSADFPSRVMIGDQVTNLTDGSSCVVISLTATSVNCGGRLAGGARNLWSRGDSYEIQNPAALTFKADGAASRFLRVNFDLGNGGAPLNPNTLSPDDFLVQDAQVVRTMLEQGGARVLLELKDPLPTDAHPLVELVGEIADMTGNTVTPFAGPTAVAADDGLTPVFNVIVAGDSPDRPLSRDLVTVHITSSEPLGLHPVVSASYLVYDEITGTLREDPVSASPVVSSSGSLSWSATLRIDQIKGLPTAGLVNLRIVGADASGNAANAGLPDPDGPDPSFTGRFLPGALVFEFDNALNGGNPTSSHVFSLSPNAGSAQRPVAGAGRSFVNINFCNPLHPSECGEHPAARVIAMRQPNPVYPGKSILLTSALLTRIGSPTADVLPIIQSVSPASFRLPLADMAPGQYTLLIQARDAAGNLSTLPGSASPTNFLFLFEVPAFGSIAGSVTLQDSPDASIASVTLSPGGVTIPVGPNGFFSLDGIASGAYTVTVVAPGYLPSQRLNVIVDPGQAALLPPFRLQKTPTPPNNT
ncbi:MAG: hypothetical protein FJ320_12485 [SAR202 cluster bacterium]|nr:hypothetical protein [SAR202 cluster bacterium]